MYLDTVLKSVKCLSESQIFYARCMYVGRHALVSMYVCMSVCMYICKINNAALLRLHSSLTVNNATYTFNKN